MYNNTYHNNCTYGSPTRPIMFEVSEGTISGVESVILTATQPFFDELRYGCNPCSVCFAIITNCIEFGTVKPIFITDDGSVYYPVRTRENGFTLFSDQIQSYAGSRRLIKLLNCYDADGVQNNHINILSCIDPKHRKCNCTPAPQI